METDCTFATRLQSGGVDEYGWAVGHKEKEREKKTMYEMLRGE